ncbi:MAG: autotransporter-associated beta strand repeat-containing protein, partial [Verrucomicrobiota bacterium]|nr:autotransporter-associated beta strand repeat-containing protein [Verrucomicrobiota bacterium]
VSNNGAIDNVSGNSTLSGARTLSGASRINSDTGTLTLSGGITGTNTNLSLGGAGNIAVSSAIATGTGGVTVDGSGTVTFSGAANTYTGDTTVSAGTLNLGKAANITAIAGNLVVNGGTVSENASGQIASTSTVNLDSGAFNLGASDTQSITQFNSVSGGTVALNTGSTLTISGTGNSTLNGTITGAGSLATGGVGSVALNGANTYSGGSTLASIVTAGNGNALGTGAVTINGGGNLQVQSGVTIANNFTLNGTGTTANDGAIENLSGNNTFSGTGTLAGNSRLQSDAGTLTLSNGISLGANTLNVGGNSNTSLSGIVSGAGGLTKDGTGTLTLSGANTFTGTTAINAGTLTTGAQNVLSTCSSVTIASGATLNLNNVNNNIQNLSNSGAIDFGSLGGETLTLSGTNTLAGSLANASGTLVVASGATLTLGANFNDPNLNIILAGGTLNLNGTTDIFGSFQITTAYSILDFASAADSVLTVNSVSFQNTGLTLSVTDWTDASDYFYSNNNPGLQGSPPTNQIVFATFTGNSTKWLSYIDGPGSNHQLTPVPEPSAYGAALLGVCLGLFIFRRKLHRGRERADNG